MSEDHAGDANGAPQTTGQVIPLRRPYTQFDNALLDDAMAEMSGAAWKVLSYFIRRTMGFWQDEVRVSVAAICEGQRGPDGRVIEKGTGLSRKAVTLALKELHGLGMLWSDAAEVSQTKVRTYRITPASEWKITPCRDMAPQLTRVKKTRVTTPPTQVKTTQVKSTREAPSTRVKKTRDGAETRVKITHDRNKERERKSQRKIAAADTADGATAPYADIQPGLPIVAGAISNPSHNGVAQKKPRPRNPIWDTLVEVMGYEPSPGAESSKWGKVVHDLKAAEATPEQIRQRAAAYPLHFGDDCLFTVTALGAHWSELAGPPRRKPVPSRPNRQSPREEPKQYSRYVQPDGTLAPSGQTGGLR